MENLLYFIISFCIIFIWIWSLPLLLVAFIFAIPSAIILLPVCIFSGVVLQWYYHDQIMPNTFLRQQINKIPFHKWFPCNQIHIKSPQLIAVHPHGLLCCGALCGIHFVPGSQTLFCVAPVLFFVPIVGWVIRLLGFIPAKRNIMLQTLRKGHQLIVVPGGVPEIVCLESQNDHERFERHGFLRIAHDANVDVTTVFVKNECKTFNMIPLPFRKERIQCSYYFNIPFVIPLFFGYYGTWIPKRIPLQLIQWKAPHDKHKYKEKLSRFLLNA